jgi:hypothetical protein
VGLCVPLLEFDQVWVDRLRQAGLFAVLLHNLLNSARGERPEPPSLEEISVARRGVQVTLEHQAETRRKQDVAVLGAFAAIDEDLAGIEVDIARRQGPSRQRG